MVALTNPEIMKIVNRYIGVSDGCLGDFSCRTHAEFYPEYCELDIDPNQYEGTTRKRFIEILRNSPSNIQAKIIRGVLERFPLEAENKPQTRTQELHKNLLDIACKLEELTPIESPQLKITSEVVERAIADIEIIIKETGAVSGVDRVHTALHGYLKGICDLEKIPYDKNDTMTKMFKKLRQNHFSFQNIEPHSSEIERILNSFANIMDAFNPIRNHGSVAHPNKDLLKKDEAMLVINVARTILHYLDAKLR